MAAGVFTPYSTVVPMLGALPTWVPVEDQERIASYQTYEEIYWNNPDTFKIVSRGPDNQPIYVPSGRIIVDTTNRYVATGFDFAVTPDVGTPDQVREAVLSLTSLFRREKFKSRFAMNKRYGLIRGDWLWHIIADPLKPEGSRISIRAVDPAAYFPVYDDNDLDRIVRVHLAEQFLASDGKLKIKRLTYERLDNGQIQVSEGIFDPKEWWGLGAPEEVVRAPAVLPPQITAFPVYHIRNFEEPGNPFGSSELRGLERIITAVNQSVSDEDLALALEGLGMYATDGGGPVDDEGNDADWILGPGRVVENAINFRRVDGVGSLTPYSEHIDRLVTFMREASAVSDAAVGKVDVQVAESGVALAFQLGPMLSRAEEKDQEIVDVHTQMFYDLRFWFAAYEGKNFVDTEVLPTLGDKLPTNRKAEVDLVVSMMSTDPPLMSATTGREYLSRRGIHFAADELARIAQEGALRAEASAAALADPQGERMDAELSTIGGASDSAE